MAGDPAGQGGREDGVGPFQSAPAIDGGRSDTYEDDVPAEMKFQSAPAIDGGRSWT